MALYFLPASGRGQSGGIHWDRLQARFDANHDGKITSQEFTGPREMFRRLDQDGDGEIVRSEADAAGPRPSGNRAGTHPPLGADRAPKQGAEAPKVSAKTPDGKVVDLSKPPRTTVLVFGSHT